MNKLAALALALAFALPPLLVAAPARAKPASALALATKGFALAQTQYRVGRTTFETVLGWAHRLRRLEGRAARKKHLARVKALGKLVKARVAAGQATQLDAILAELELALAREGKLRWK